MPKNLIFASTGPKPEIVIQDASTTELLSFPMPENQGPTDDLLRRFLDKAVFDHVHSLRAQENLPPYQTVRSPFLEGKPLYDNTFFRLKTHIQIAVGDATCIKGYFLPRQ